MADSRIERGPEPREDKRLPIEQAKVVPRVVLQKELADLSAEYAGYQDDPSAAQLKQKCRRRVEEIRRALEADEEIMECRIPVSAQGAAHPFRIGDAVYPAGTYLMPLSRWRHLEWIISRNKIVENHRMEDRGNGELVSRDLDDRFVPQRASAQVYRP